MIPRRRTQKEGTSTVSNPHDDATATAASTKTTRSKFLTWWTPSVAGRILKVVCLGALLVVCLWNTIHRTSTAVSDAAAVVSPTSSPLSSQETQSQTQQQKRQSPPRDPWKFFNGDLNKFYNNLEKDIRRDANNIDNYAVHRWMGKQHSTYEHYYLLKRALQTYHPLLTSSSSSKLRVFDGGCGLGAGLMWFEREEPEWTLLGHTISQVQYDWIQHNLPKHRFETKLQSYDELDTQVDFIYTIEALLHSPNLTHTMEVWATHLDDGGMLCVIDDFLAIGARRDDEEVADFVQSWQAPSLVTPTEMVLIAQQFGLDIKEARDLNAEYQINEMHYRNELEAVIVSGDRTHQAWKGSKVRGRLMVLGKITYHMLVFQKPFRASTTTTTSCTPVLTKKEEESGATFVDVAPHHVLGTVKPLSSAFQCNNVNQTRDFPLGNVDREIVGGHQSILASRMNEFYTSLSPATRGKFLAIERGFANDTNGKGVLSGPLEYWSLNPDGKQRNHMLLCNVTNCPIAQDCSFDVTFSHGVLEHTNHPFEAFDLIARVTKQGGLALHVVPFSLPYHDGIDNYRFSHSALEASFKERGFAVLDIGYDFCIPSKSRRIDEQQGGWLTYIVARKT